MPRIEWQEALSVGIKSIDEQHKNLLVTFNALLEANAAGKTSPADDLVACLKTFAAEHFHVEEGYMQAFAYPETAAHQKEHEDFLAAVALFESACAEGRGNPNAVLGFLETWINGHLAGADRRMGRYLEDYLR
jgi:hemerythrin-like metal-binding domain